MNLSKKIVWKPDGRYAVIYRRSPRGRPADSNPLVTLDLARLRPSPSLTSGGGELRWDPLKQAWVILAAHRQDRIYFPSHYCPLCPTTKNNPSELPVPFDYAIFENQFPSFFPHPHAPSKPAALSRTRPERGSPLWAARPARGLCEVIVYTPDHHAALSRQPRSTLEGLVRVWQDRYVELSRAHWIKYIYIFENRGVSVGVTLHHPHGQLYAFPYVPPVAEQERGGGPQLGRRTRRCLMCDLSRAERRERVRVVLENDRFVAYVPFSARWPYELHITSKRHLASLAVFTPPDVRALAAIFRTTLRAYDRLFHKPLPYVMAMHQAPTRTTARPWDHWHLEFYPPQRTKEKLKFLAGVELGAGSFILDVAPEQAAAALRRATARS